MKYINYGDYIMPLVACKHIVDTNSKKLIIKLERYIGTCFFIGDNGQIATCGHIVENKQDDDFIYGKNLNTNEIDMIYDLKVHPKYDFAIGYFRKHKDHKVFNFGKMKHAAGMDVRTFGFTDAGKDGKDINIVPRLFKGNIVGYGLGPKVPKSRSTVELSFPSLSGFSGSPLLNEHTDELIGMLFHNTESRIEVYSNSEIDEDGKITKESVNRIVELGLAHSIEDIIQFISDLKINLSE